MVKVITLLFQLEIKDDKNVKEEKKKKKERREKRRDRDQKRRWVHEIILLNLDSTCTLRKQWLAGEKGKV